MKVLASKKSVIAISKLSQIFLIVVMFGFLLWLLTINFTVVYGTLEIVER